MGCVLPKCLDGSVPTPSRSPSPPYSRSFSPDGYENPAIEEGDSRVWVERRRSNSWSFYQLRLFLEYKGIKEGVEVMAVPPAYTSQTCHQCLHIGLSSDKRFQCGNGGWYGDADLNGAKMISLLGQSVSLPGGSGYLCCNLSTDRSGLLKAPGFDTWGSLHTSQTAPSKM